MPGGRLLAEASLWSADFTRLGDEIRRVDNFADLYHFDASDAHLVPGLLFFPDLVAALRPLTHKPFHIHLMADNPLSLIDDFVNAGADLITIHSANVHHVTGSLEKIRAYGPGAGLALSLEDPVESVFPYLGQIDLVLMMGTQIGIKGQDLSPLACPRIQKMRALINSNGYSDGIKIEADGGIRAHTVPQLRAAGADLVVMGSLLFRSTDLQSTFAWLHGLAK